MSRFTAEARGAPTVPPAAAARARADNSSVLAGALFLLGGALHWLAGAPALVVAAFLAMPPILLLALFARRQHKRLRAARKSLKRGLAKATAQAARHLAALSDSERRFHGAFTQASIGMALLSLDGRILQANAAMAAIFGIGRSEQLTQCDLIELVDASERAALTRALQDVVEGRCENFSLELRCPHGGAELWVSFHGALLHDAEAPSLIVQLQDVSARRHAQAQLKHIAFHDGLTACPTATASSSSWHKRSNRLRPTRHSTSRCCTSTSTASSWSTTAWATRPATSS